jgi:hypothetical protein
MEGQNALTALDMALGSFDEQLAALRPRVEGYRRTSCRDRTSPGRDARSERPASQSAVRRRRRTLND